MSVFMCRFRFALLFFISLNIDYHVYDARVTLCGLLKSIQRDCTQPTESLSRESPVPCGGRMEVELLRRVVRVLFHVDSSN